jgi:hypothetical protein
MPPPSPSQDLQGSPLAYPLPFPSMTFPILRCPPCLVSLYRLVLKEMLQTGQASADQFSRLPSLSAALVLDPGMSSRRLPRPRYRLRPVKAFAALCRWIASLQPGTTGTALELALLHPAASPGPGWDLDRASQLGCALRLLEGHGAARATGTGRTGIAVWAVGGGVGLPWA